MAVMHLEDHTEAWKRDVEDIRTLREEIQAKVRDAERLSAQRHAVEEERARQARLLAAQARCSAAAE